jgi:hypothetical protein
MIFSVRATASSQFCSLARAPASLYCGAHRDASTRGERVPCPVDSSHTIFKAGRVTRSLNEVLLQLCFDVTIPLAPPSSSHNEQRQTSRSTWRSVRLRSVKPLGLRYGAALRCALSASVAKGAHALPTHFLCPAAFHHQEHQLWDLHRWRHCCDPGSVRQWKAHAECRAGTPCCVCAPRTRVGCSCCLLCHRAAVSP